MDFLRHVACRDLRLFRHILSRAHLACMNVVGPYVDSSFLTPVALRSLLTLYRSFCLLFLNILHHATAICLPGFDNG